MQSFESRFSSARSTRIALISGLRSCPACNLILRINGRFVASIALREPSRQCSVSSAHKVFSLRFRLLGLQGFSSAMRLAADILKSGPMMLNTALLSPVPISE